MLNNKLIHFKVQKTGFRYHKKITVTGFCYKISCQYDDKFLRSRSDYIKRQHIANYIHLYLKISVLSDQKCNYNNFFKERRIKTGCVYISHFLKKLHQNISFEQSKQ